MEKEEREKILLAGKIGSEAVAYAKSFIKRDMKLIDIAEKIEDKIRELGGEPAFPTGLSIDSIAAHYTPYPNDETLAHGLLKVDLGAHVDGYISDTSFSIDLDNNKENLKLIEASESALENVSKIVKKGGVLATYSCAKIVRENLIAAGFEVKDGPCVGRRAPSTIAIKK